MKIKIAIFKIEINNDFRFLTRIYNIIFKFIIFKKIKYAFDKFKKNQIINDRVNKNKKINKKRIIIIKKIKKKLDIKYNFYLIIFLSRKFINNYL